MNKISILLVDDHKWVREGFRLALETKKELRIVGEAGDGDEAIKLTKQLKPELVLMDINMPKKNGIEAVKEIRKFNKNVKIIMLTMLENERFIFEALSEGINGYIYKDSDLSELKEAIVQVVNGEDYFNKEVTHKIIKFYSNKSNIVLSDSSPKESPLTKRELEIVKLVSEGLTSNLIAERLFISPHTVVKHRKNIIKKLEVKNFNEVVKYSIINELI